MTNSMGGDWKIGECFVTCIVNVIHYMPNFRPSPSHLCFVFVLLASIAWVLAGGMVDMAMLGIRAGSTAVVISDIVAAAPPVIPVLMVLDWVRVGWSAVESLLCGLGWGWTVHGCWPLLWMCCIGTV